MQGEISLIEDEQVAMLGGGGNDDARAGGGGLAGVDDFEDQISALEFRLGALNADALNGVAPFTQSGGIDETKGDAVDLDDFFDGVARGAGGGADDGALEAEQAIEEATFADVGFANDDGAGAVTEDAALLGGVEQAAGVGEEIGKAALKGGAGVGRNVFLRKIDVGFDVGEDVDQGLAEGFGFAADDAGELFVGGTNGEGALGMDEVHDGLGLSEIHFAVEESALGEFARFGMAGTGFEEGFQETLSDQNAAVALELKGGFASVTSAAVKEDDDALVEDEAFGVTCFGEVNNAWWEVGKSSAGVQDAAADG